MFTAARPTPTVMKRKALPSRVSRNFRLVRLRRKIRIDGTDQRGTATTVSSSRITRCASSRTAPTTRATASSSLCEPERGLRAL